MLSRKVIREALGNAVMRRSYQEHSPVQIIRYSSRIEILNPGYSLKNVASLGTPRTTTPGSRRWRVMGALATKPRR